MRVDELLAGPMVHTILVRLENTWRRCMAMDLIQRWRIRLPNPDHSQEKHRNGIGVHCISIYGLRHKKQNQQIGGLVS